MTHVVSKADFKAALDEVENSLIHYSETGIQGFDCRPDSLKMIETWGVVKRYVQTRRPESLETIRADLGDCTRCRLCEGRRYIVFGEGNPGARLVFVGEGPGKDEDNQGRPFVGAAGQLLTRIIGAMTLTRDQVYIGNVIKCRPPRNRTPLPDEIDTCIPYIKRQIRSIQPEFICTLGAVATQSLLGSREPISKLRGRFHDCMGIQLLPTYHPAYLLRNQEKKRVVWEDIQKLMRAMDLKPEKSGR